MAKTLTDAHFKVLREISERVPAELLSRLTKKEEQFTTLKEVLMRGLQEPDDVVSPEEKRKLQNILDSGYLDKQVEVVDYDVEKEIAEYYDYEIKKAVDAGLLPRTAPALKLLKNKGPEYAKRQRKRLKKLFMGEDSDVASAPQGTSADDQEDAGGHSPRSDDSAVLRSPSEAERGGGRHEEEGREEREGGSDQGGTGVQSPLP